LFCGASPRSTDQPRLKKKVPQSFIAPDLPDAEAN
jgi:hypothetical protein